MALENKKVKNEKVDKGLVISFSDEDYPKGFDRDHNNLMVIASIVHNHAIKEFLLIKEAR